MESRFNEKNGALYVTLSNETRVIAEQYALPNWSCIDTSRDYANNALGSLLDGEQSIVEKRSNVHRMCLSQRLSDMELTSRTSQRYRRKE